MTEIRDYHQWSIAAVRFSVTPDAVGDKQRERLDADVERAIMLEAAMLGSPEALGVSIPEDQIEVAAEEWSRVHPSSDLSDAAIMNGIRRELSVQAILDRVAAKATLPSAGEAKEFFAANMQKFHLPERRAVRHILVAVNSDNTEAEAKTRVDRLINALDAGEEFGDLAGQYSECPTSVQAGQVGTVSQGTLYPEVDELAFALGAGSWGGPVRTELGWHLVSCDEILASEKPDYDAVADRIMAHLTQQAQRAAQVTWLKALTDQFVV